MRNGNGKLIYAADPSALENTVNTLYGQISTRDNALCELEDGEDTVDADAFAKQYPQVCILINQMHLVMERLPEEDALCDSIRRAARAAATSSSASTTATSSP